MGQSRSVGLSARDEAGANRSRDENEAYRMKGRKRKNSTPQYLQQEHREGGYARPSGGSPRSIIYCVERLSTHGSKILGQQTRNGKPQATTQHPWANEEVNRNTASARTSRRAP